MFSASTASVTAGCSFTGGISSISSRFAISPPKRRMWEIFPRALSCSILNIIPLNSLVSRLPESGIYSTRISASSFIPTEYFALPEATGVRVQADISFFIISSAFSFVSTLSSRKASAASSDISARTSVAYKQNAFSSVSQTRHASQPSFSTLLRVIIADADMLLSSSVTFCTSAPARSALFMKITRGSRAVSRALRMFSVCALTPSTAETITTA